MQTFVPFQDHVDTAMILDTPRLGKQRVESYQILKALTGVSTGWINHPATKMWKGHEAGLCYYTLIICGEWCWRGYKDTIMDKIVALVEPSETDYPSWWGDKRVHDSHRGNLLRKKPDHYGKYFPDADPTIPYFWPV